MKFIKIIKNHKIIKNIMLVTCQIAVHVILTMDLRNERFKHGNGIPCGCNQIRVHNVNISRRAERYSDCAVCVVRMVFAEPTKRNRFAALVMIRMNEIFNALAQRVVFILQRHIVSVAQRGVGRRNFNVTTGIFNIGNHFLAFFNEKHARLSDNLGI